MGESEDGTVVALDMVGKAAAMLDAIGNSAGAERLRHASAIVEHDVRLPAHNGLERPLKLMQEALALLDRDGFRLSDAAAKLQSAIDSARDDQLRDDGEINVSLLAPRV